MGYSIELYFERRFEDSLCSLWDALESAGVPSVLHQIGSRPHLSLVVLDDCIADHITDQLDSGVTGRCKFPIAFPAFSIRSGNPYSVFLTPTINSELIGLQKCLYELVKGEGSSIRNHYAPHHWLPHCSISKEMSCTEALKTLDVCLSNPTIRETWVTDIGFIEFRPRKVIKTMELADSLDQ